MLDNVQDHAKEIDDLLAVARHRDDEVQRLAAGKQYAGDPDPYKSEDEDDEDDDAVGAAGPRVTRPRAARECPTRSASAAVEAVAAAPRLRAGGRGPADLPRQPGRRRARQHARLRARAAAARRHAACGRPSRASSRCPTPFAELPGLDLLVPQARRVRRPRAGDRFDVAAESRLGDLADRLPRGAGACRARPPRVEHPASAGSTWSTRARRPPRWWSTGCWTGSACRWTRRSPSASTWRWPPTPARSSST